MPCTFIHCDEYEDESGKPVSHLDGLPSPRSENTEVQCHVEDMIRHRTSKHSVDGAMTASDSIQSDSSCSDFSVGSVGHSTGKCKPCAWHRKPSGCSKGDQCSYCHLCE